MPGATVSLSMVMMLLCPQLILDQDRVPERLGAVAADWEELPKAGRL
jgi:hypothetical protein